MQLGRAEPGGQFQQGEGVSTGIAQQALRDLTWQRVTAAFVEELAGRFVVEAMDLEDGQPRWGEWLSGRVAGPGREDHGHRVRGQLPGREQQGVRRC